MLYFSNHVISGRFASILIPIPVLFLHFAPSGSLLGRVGVSKLIYLVHCLMMADLSLWGLVSQSSIYITFHIYL